MKPLGLKKAVYLSQFCLTKIGPYLPITKIAKKNIINTLSKNIKIDLLIKKVWYNVGAFIAEFYFIHNMKEEELLKRIEIIGIENILDLKKSKQPFLMFTGHFANWDIAVNILHNFYQDFAVIYRKPNNPYINRLLNNIRSNKKITFIPKGITGIKPLMLAIKKGFSIGMLVDQKMNDGIEVPLLGKPAMTAHAIAKLALKFSYPIIPLQIIRTNESCFQLIIHPSVKYSKTNNYKQDCYNIMFIINNILSEWIKLHPEQWFWFHNRWKK